MTFAPPGSKPIGIARDMNAIKDAFNATQKVAEKSTSAPPASMPTGTVRDMKPKSSFYDAVDAAKKIVEKQQPIMKSFNPDQMLENRKVSLAAKIFPNGLPSLTKQNAPSSVNGRTSLGELVS